VFTCDDLLVLAEHVAETWTAAADRDWSAPAGTLDWSCTRTADHTVDTVLAPAFFLASRKLDGYPAFEPFTLGQAPSVPELVEGLLTAARILTAVVTVTPADARARIWNRPPEARGPADFVPRAGLELILHGHDIASGLGVAFRPPTPIAERLRQHTRTWPFWDSPGWRPLAMHGEPWADLLRSSGRDTSENPRNESPGSD
jgi:hypothetical protein